MIEMLVVLGIIVLVTGITLPMVVPMMRTRTLDSAVDTVKSACRLARSTAIQQRKMINLTFLQQTDGSHGPGAILTAYDFAGAVTSGVANSITDNNQNWTANAFLNDQLLLFSAGNSNPQIATIQSNSGNTITITSSWTTAPAPGNVYVVMSAASPAQPYCIHYLGNYNNNGDVRFNVLKTFSLYMGETLQYLPTGCQFTFSPAWSSSVAYSAGNMVSDNGSDYKCVAGNTNSEPPSANWQAAPGAWTCVFLPNGQAWTVLPSATNTRDTNWFLTTYMANGAVSGPKIWGPQNRTSATIIVYSTTGQAASQ